ncbi:putative membrane protein [Virgibacillus natechei]|uniref:Membrane protein n=1 Tax=Virgibacillus natechei TaxID=1216297 RepID=A0ABS4IIA0_9BACI|nr:YhgE/Pip domain-containing protein [Virgibacillus natechei]MBP1970071.1 putative membrane protein [Virgibacillus natechei]UZD14152.1 YhgE/Pip domain-containing protein [Virgibacillus natechei]
MKGISHELRGIFASKKLVIALMGIILMPLLYGGLLIWSFWDPYGEIESLPVAVVNEDEGAMLEGEEVQAGDEFIANLQDEAALDFHFVSEAEARRGMNDFEYYFYVHIPEVFSEDVISVMEDEPARGTLYYEVNEDYNFVSSQIADSAISEMEEELSEALTFAYVEVANDSFNTFSNHLNDIEDGTESLLEANYTVLDGAGDLSSGLAELMDGVGELTEGIEQLNTGVKQAEAEWLHVTDTLEHSDQMEEGRSTFASIRDKTEEIEAFLEHGDTHALEEQLDEWLDLVETLNQSLDSYSITENLDHVESVYKDMEKAQQRMDEVAEKLEREEEGMQDVFDESLQLANDVEQFLNEFTVLASEPIETIEEMEAHYHKLPDLLDNHFPEWEENEELVAWYESGLADFEGEPNDQYEMEEQVDNMNRRLVEFQNQMEEEQQSMESIVEPIDDGKQEINKVVTALDTFYDGLDEAEGTLHALESTLQDIQEAGEGLQSYENFNTIETKVYQSVAEVNDGLDNLESVYQTALSYQDEVTSGLAQLSEGTTNASDGASNLEEGIMEANSGGKDLVNGLEDVREGTNEINSNIAELAEVTNGISPSAEQEEMASSPIESQSTFEESNYSYGEGLTPYFLSIGLYVGALTLSIIYPFREALGPHENGKQWFLGKLGVILIVASLQVSVLLVFLLYILNLSVESPLAFIGFTYLVSFVFMSLIFMLVGVLDNPGRFIAIVLLILQLGGSGGTFPVELLASPLQTIHGWLPMTYSVLGFRSVIFMDSPVLLGQSMVFLVTMAIITLAITFYFYHKKYRKLGNDVES